MVTATRTAIKTQPMGARSTLAPELVVCSAAALVALLYSFLVNHIWEDYFITFRHSQNLFDGNGLLYNQGDRLHGFTSPLGTLLPGLCYLMSGRIGWEPAFWVFRILSIMAFAGGCFFVLRSFRIAKPYYPLSGIAIGLLYMFDAKFVEFSTDGQESAFMLLFLAGSIYLLMAGFPERWLAGGLCWAGLMWTRPDGFVYVFALALSALLFSEGSRLRVFVSLLKSAAVCALVYGPWFAWTWVYYGSPVPQTVVAKSNLYAGGVGTLLNEWVGGNFKDFLPRAIGAFQAIYDVGDKPWWPGHEWSQWLLVTSAEYLSVFCIFYWLLPVNDRLGRIASLCFAITCVYFSLMSNIFPWYYPPATLFGLIVLTRAAFTFAALAETWFPNDWLFRRARVIAVIFVAVLCARQFMLLALVGKQMRVQQVEIEEGNRIKVAEFLKENMKPNDRIMLEPFGYIGYFSGGRIMDWPGLVSREITTLRKEKKLWFDGLANELEPEWLVLRPEDISGFSRFPFFKNYALVRVFDVTDRLREYGDLPGPSWLKYDARFLVFQKLASLHEPSPYREETIPLSPAYVHHMRWDGNAGGGAGENSYLMFRLPQRQHVSAIRIKFTYTDTESPAAFVFSWGKGDQKMGELGERMACPVPTDPGEKTLVVKVDNTIDQFRISPANKPFQFTLLKIELLAPIPH